MSEKKAANSRNMSLKKKIIVIASIIVVILTSFVFMVGYIAADSLLHPAREKLYDFPWNHNMTAENITFTTSDGVTIKGWFIPSTGGPNSTATIILAHGYTHSRCQMMPYAIFLHKAGYNIVMFDFRAHGESGGKMSTIALREPKDIIAAVDWISHRPGLDINRTGVLGISLGAASAIRAAGMDHRIKAVVADSSFSTGDRVAVRAFTYFSGYPSFPFGPVAIFFIEMQLGARASDVNVPDYAAKMDNNQHLLIIQGDKDQIAGTEDAKLIYSKARCDKEMWIIPGTGHVDGIEDHPQEYQDKVLDFFDRTL